MPMRWCFIILACLLGHAAAVCYLEDANAACAVCWRTAYSGPEDKTGVTTMAECPKGIAVSWLADVPQEMFAGSVYPVTYRLTVDEAKFPVYKKGKEGSRNHVPHANIHSCIASRGACTPFVANSSGLATHFPASVGNLTTGGVVKFTSDIKLSADVYTIIAHVRFYTDNDKDVTLPHVKYDVAIGVTREVIPQVVAVSADSYAATGTTGGILIVVIASMAWAARSGRLDVDLLLETIYSEHVTCMVSMIGGLADAIAFSVCVFTVMQTDNALVQALPACYFFMCTSWLGSLYVSWTDLMQLKAMYLQHSSRERFVKHLARNAGRRQVNKVRRLSLERTNSDNSLQINGVAVDPKCKTSMKTLKDEFESKINKMGSEDMMYDMMLELEVSARELTRKQGDVLTILAESIPITAIQIYVLNTAKDSHIVPIITLVVASIILGAKVSGLGGYRESRIRRDKAEQAFRKHFGIEVVDDKHQMVVSKDELDKMASGELIFVHTEMGEPDKKLKDTARSSEASSRLDIPYFSVPQGQAVQGIRSSIQMGAVQHFPSASAGLGPVML